MSDAARQLGSAFALALVLACGSKDRPQVPASSASSASVGQTASGGAAIPRAASQPIEDSPGQHVMPCQRVADAYGAYLAGRTAEATREVATLVERSGDTFAELDLTEWSSARASASDRYVLIESARGWLRDGAGGSSARHCGELLVDVSTHKILRYLRIEPFAALKNSTFFVGETVAVWKVPGHRALMRVADWHEADTFAGEATAALPGANRILVANQPAGATRAYFEVRDVATHKTLARMDPRGDGPVSADGNMSGFPLALLANGSVLVALVSGEMVGFDIARGTRLFSLATDFGDLGLEPSADQRFAVAQGVCDFAMRQPPVPAPGCVPKTACPTSSVCAKLQNARIDLGTGAITWQRYDPTAPRKSPPTMLYHSLERPPDEAFKRLGKMFCIAGELLVPRDLCPATLVPKQP